MSLIAFTNTKKHTVHIGGKAIKSNETREIEETLAPDYKAQKPVEETPLSPLEELLSGNVKSILEAIRDLSDDDLQALQEMEDEAEQPRKGVLDGLLKETLERASAGGEGE